MIENRVNSCEYYCCTAKNDFSILKSDMMYIRSQYVTLECIRHMEVIGRKIDNSSLSQFIFIWYDYSVEESYNNITGTKTDAHQNEKTQLKKAVKKLSEYIDPGITLSQKPIGT